MGFQIENIPSELHDLKQWVCWKKIPTAKEGKFTKIPINPYTGKNAMSNNPDTWSTLFEAVAGCFSFNLDGIGFMFASGYFGVDLDDCSEELKNEFIQGLESYTEISQSGNGIHIICKGHLPKGSRRCKGVEMYDSQRFFVMTGNKIGNYNIEERTERIIPLYNKYLKPKNDTTIVSPVVPSVITLEDTQVLTKAQNSKNGMQFKILFDGNWNQLNYPSQSEADMALCNLLAFWCGRNKNQMDRIFRMSGLYRDKWDRRLGGTTYGDVTLEAAISNCHNVYTPNIPENNILINANTGEVAMQSNMIYEENDTGNAHRLVDRFEGLIKYNVENKMWKIWNGKYWQTDATDKIKSFAEVVINEMKLEAIKCDNELERKTKVKNVERAFSSRGKEAMIKEAIHLDGVACFNADFDKDKYYFNTADGVYDLKNGEMLEHNKDMLVSKISNISVSFEKPKLWLKFLNEVFLGDKELIHFIHKAVGYSLTGDISEQCFFVCYGGGSNGKSVFMDIISRLLGDYSMNIQIETILEKKGGNGGASSDLARLKGARYVTAGENNDGTRLNEGLIKQMTGGERITARHLYGREFDYYPELKLWISTNHKPEIKDTSDGTWRRIMPIPFLLKIDEEKKDQYLVQKLCEELPQILGWAIEGCKMWQVERLKPCKAVKDAQTNYKKEMDIINNFIEDCCEEIKDYYTTANDIYAAYCEWAKKNNEFFNGKLLSSTKFGRELAKRFDKERKSYGVAYKGVILKEKTGKYVFKQSDCFK